MDSCLSVIAQALMESCSTSDLKLSKDSPSSKLLFAKDIAGYQEMVGHYYEDIKYNVPEVSEQAFNHILTDQSKVRYTYLSWLMFLSHRMIQFSSVQYGMVGIDRVVLFMWCSEMVRSKNFPLPLPLLRKNLPFRSALIPFLVESGT